MTDLVEFLRARLDEDEQTAREAGNRRWLVQDNIIELYPEREDDGFMSWPTRADARHAARWEPARVLHEIEAKRQNLRDLEEAERSLVVATSGPPHDLMTGAVNTLRRMARLLALPYADHPDYREEWRP